MKDKFSRFNVFINFWFQISMYKYIIIYYVIVTHKILQLYGWKWKWVYSVISLRVMIHCIDSLISDKTDK